MIFDEWLRTVCFQKPTPEAYDLAKSAWNAAIKAASEAVDDHDYGMARCEVEKLYIDAKKPT